MSKPRSSRPSTRCGRATIYLFTTGGIGPTHDDITADSVAKAFGVGIDEDPRAIALLLERIKPEDLNEARRRMARIPHGADLIENSVSKAPGFMLGNVIVMAGVPAIMQAMLDSVVTRLETGVQVIAETIEAAGLPEGAYAAGARRACPRARRGFDRLLPVVQRPGVPQPDRGAGPRPRPGRGRQARRHPHAGGLARRSGPGVATAMHEETR